MSLRHPLAPEADSGMPVSTVSLRSPKKSGVNHRDTNIPALADSTKSPSLCLSPGLSPLALHTDNPGAANNNNSISWNKGFQQGQDGEVRHQGIQPRLMTSTPRTESATRPFVLEGKMEALPRGLGRDEMGGVGYDVGVPVILSLGDKSKKSVTTEIPLQDIVNGAACTLKGIYQHARCFVFDLNWKELNDLQN